MVIRQDAVDESKPDVGSCSSIRKDECLNFRKLSDRGKFLLQYLFGKHKRASLSQVIENYSLLFINNVAYRVGGNRPTTDNNIGIINLPQQWKQLERSPSALMVYWRHMVPETVIEN